MRDALLEFVQILREDAYKHYQHNQLLYVLGGLKQHPSVPELLKNGGA
jgi:hypothetical protein